MSIFYCLYFLEFPNLEGQVPVFIYPRNRVAQLYLQAMGKDTGKKKLTFKDISLRGIELAYEVL
jgi:hypothetical protein